MTINNGLFVKPEYREPAGLYIHYPFCLKKCDYCGFVSLVNVDEASRERYVSCLIKEIKCYANKRVSIDTIFIGGGTPSLMTGEQIKKILDAVKEAFIIPSYEIEVTIEANPKTLSADKLAGYRQVGINRLSIGCQSLSNKLLLTLGRIHSREDFIDNYRLARKAGFDNINIDLMFNIPGQDLRVWNDTLDEIIELRPEHISFYSLELEEGTPYYQRYKNGDLDLVSDTVLGKMYKNAVSRLKDAHYGHYEISNCAIPGFECKHNLKYWSFVEYYGIGAGAHSFNYRYGRRANPNDVDQYMEIMDSDLSYAVTSQDQVIDERELMGEYVFTQLRKLEGVNTDSFYHIFGVNFYQVFCESKSELWRYQSLGYLTIDGSRIALTEDGILKSNQIMAEFV